jgi:hypothetical protein
LLRRVSGVVSKQERMSDWQTETFWCMTTVPGSAPMTRATSSPTESGISHHPSAHARTPRVAHVSA